MEGWGRGASPGTKEWEKKRRGRGGCGRGWHLMGGASRGRDKGEDGGGEGWGRGGANTEGWSEGGDGSQAICGRGWYLQGGAGMRRGEGEDGGRAAVGGAVRWRAGLKREGRVARRGSRGVVRNAGVAEQV